MIDLGCFTSGLNLPWQNHAPSGFGRVFAVRLRAESEVGVDDAAVMQQLMRGAFECHGTHLQHIAAVGHLQRSARILLDQQH